MKKILDVSGKFLYEIIENEYIKKPVPNLPFWIIYSHHSFDWIKIFFRTKKYKSGAEGQKILLEEILKEFSGSIVFGGYENDPILCKLKGTWLKTGKNEWKIPVDIDFNEFFEWIDLGGWYICPELQEAGKKLSRPRYDFRKAEDNILSLKETSLSFSLDAWYDNNPWFFGVNPEYIVSSS